MQYTIDMEFENGESKGGISIALNTANEGKVSLCSYGTEMNLQQYIEFADAVHEIRQKFAILDGKKEHGTD